MNKYAVYHITDAPYSYPKDLNTLSVIIRTAKDDIKSCRIYYKTRYDWQNPFNIKEMKKVIQINYLIIIKQIYQLSVIGIDIILNLKIIMEK